MWRARRWPSRWGSRWERPASCLSPRWATAAIPTRQGTWRSCCARSGMARLAVVDAGPLYATANAGDRDHAASRATLARADLQLVVPALVVAEATYFVATRLGPKAEAAFLRGLATLEIEPPTATDIERMADLVEEYADFPLGGTDASVVALA